MARTIVLLMLALAGCGDNGTTEPEPEPTAALRDDANGAWTNCSNFPPGYEHHNVCDFVGVGRNLGPDCAYEISGVTYFYNANEDQVGAAESWDTDLSLPDRVLPNAPFTYEIRDIERTRVDLIRTYVTEFQSWRAWEC